MKDGLSTYAVKYQLAQMRDLYMSSNYTILAHYVYNMYSNNDQHTLSKMSMCTNYALFPQIMTDNYW